MTIPWQTISESLFELDPMHTCCKENDSFDEYDFVAKRIASHIEEGILPAIAIYLSLMQLFDETSAKSVDIDALVRDIQQKKVAADV